ncbi:MAG TPA: hypothetical protein GXX33_09550 [Firmicutes bacterium]|uniref:Site-2 protease family protein n=1 Tax=Capillibacterium thermochitinicola TaxID=2699427 RepID=A0A8J6LT14_9FIRM|nr:site-2 protease family protein [Capillibacterium thermochitinicola]MBA2133817.1 site-2 protease family protein [Capillibacterium thermochitinicola]HHW13228.1 hypothetical protein [Bacillota bacterium]
MFKIKLNPFLYPLFFLAGLTGEISTVVLAFFSVLLHETAHLVTAFSFGYRTLCVELFPFGGVARMEASLFNDPVAEAITAVAGPVQSILLAFFCRTFAPILHLPALTGDLARINLGLGLFNLLPLFPLDGGRILRSVLVRKLGYKKATTYTNNWTKAVVCLAGPPLVWLSLKKMVPFQLPLVLFFLLIADRENNHFYSYLAQQTRRTSLLRANGLFSTKVWVVDAKRKVGEILPFLTGKDYHLFFLVDKHGKILGEVTEEELIRMINEDNMFNLKIEEIGVLNNDQPRPAGGNKD